MPDIMIRHIDRLMAERIKVLAKERQWSVNDVVLQALRHGLGVSESTGLLAETLRESRDLTASASGGQWDASEQAAFQEAMQALTVARSEQLAPVNGSAGERFD
jgi:hypothetical protein